MGEWLDRSRIDDLQISTSLKLQVPPAYAPEPPIFTPPDARILAFP